MHVARSKGAKLQPGGPPVFTGEVNSTGLSDQSTATQLFLRYVKFSPGGRTVWHTHPFEQGLVIVEGRGIVANEAQENVVEPGDIVIVSPNEKHWHGAGEKTGMAHIAINQAGGTTALEPVTEIRTKGV